MGLHTVLLTGDIESIAAETGTQLNVDEVYVQLLPSPRRRARTVR